jgi:hypothetical protein
MPHWPALQVAVPLGSVGHTVQLEPHAAGLSAAMQVPLPQSWKPELHEMPQLKPLQVAVPLVGIEHAPHELPQVAVLEFDTQVPPQS